jgi:hypothetical protein
VVRGVAIVALSCIGCPRSLELLLLKVETGERLSAWKSLHSCFLDPLLPGQVELQVCVNLHPRLQCFKRFSFDTPTEVCLSESAKWLRNFLLFQERVEFASSVQLGAARVESRAFGDHHAFSEKVRRLSSQ